jgi:hypothetical protein
MGKRRRGRGGRGGRGRGEGRENYGGEDNDGLGW